MDQDSEIQHKIDFKNIVRKNISFREVFENRILRSIFEPERDENGEWRKLHNEELHMLV